MAEDVTDIEKLANTLTDRSINYTQKKETEKERNQLFDTILGNLYESDKDHDNKINTKEAAEYNELELISSEMDDRVPALITAKDLPKLNQAPAGPQL